MGKKQKNPINITRNELVQILRNVNTPMFISFISKTPVVMNQYDNPYFEQGIQNLSRKFKIVTGFDYQNSVNGRRENEGKETDFVQKDNWFEVISKSLVVNKNDNTKYYIRYQYQNDSKGKEDKLKKEQVFESYLRERSKYENQGLDNPLQFQVCSLDNLLQISINNEMYVLV